MHNLNAAHGGSITPLAWDGRTGGIAILVIALMGVALALALGWFILRRLTLAPR